MDLDRYESFPITAEDMNRKYVELNGDCPDLDNFYPMTAFDENGVAGHLIMRFNNAEKTILRLGFVIVDDSRRGMGYGKEMIRLAVKYAFELLKVETVTLGVFDNNMPAYYCYKAAGFQDVILDRKISFQFCGETMNILELKMERKEYEQKS